MSTARLSPHVLFTCRRSKSRLKEEHLSCQLAQFLQTLTDCTPQEQETRLSPSGRSFSQTTTFHNNDKSWRSMGKDLPGHDAARATELKTTDCTSTSCTFPGRSCQKTCPLHNHIKKLPGAWQYGQDERILLSEHRKKEILPFSRRNEFGVIPGQKTG